MAVKGSAASRHSVDVRATALAERAGHPAPPIERIPTLSEAFAAHAQDVARWAARLGGPLMDVEDVVQEVFLVAHRRLPTFRGEAQLSTWLFRITHNVVKHRRRKDRLRRWLTGKADAAAELQLAPGPSADEQLELHERARTLHRVLDRLSERSRTVLVLFELESMSGEQIAHLLEAKTATVWVWLHRARAQFQKKMAELEREEGR